MTIVTLPSTIVRGTAPALRGGTVTMMSGARSTRAASLGWVPLLISALCSGGAQAQAPAPVTAPVTAPAAAEADALILQGLKLREQGQDAEALELFKRAQELAPTPRALAQRALAEQALGDWVQAEIHLREALAAADDPWIVQHRVALDGALAVIGDHLGYLQINGGLDGAELWLDGRLVGRLPLLAPLRVVVGRPLLEVTVPGHYPVRREITIKAGSLSTESIELAKVPAEPPATSTSVDASAAMAGAEQTASDRPRAGLPPPVFWTAAGVTAVVAGVTLWSGLNTVAKKDAYEDYADPERNPDATSDETERGFEAARSAQTRTNVLLAGTAVAAAATLAIGVFFTDWAASAEADGRASRAAVRMAVYSDGADHGLLLYRRF
jgi:tetratricopeptide (TPR) repeat protein